MCCGADRAVCLLSPTQPAWCRCSKTCCGYPASPAQRKRLHSNPTPRWLPTIFSISKNTPPSLLSCACIFTTSYSSETLQELTWPHILFTHLLSKHSGDPTHLFFFFLHASDIQYSCGIELKASGHCCCCSRVNAGKTQHL